MTGAELIIDFLARKGVTHAFGYPGGPVLVLYDAIYRMKFPHILTRHEQGAAHAAEGYAKVSGKPGVMIATSGPGATNLVTGLADAYLDSVPLLAITGAVTRRATGSDAFQEADITGITMPITKYNYLVMNPDELLPILEEAWNLTTEGRPGPVLVNVPKDVMALEIGTYEELSESSLRTYVRHRPTKIRTESMADKVYAAMRKSVRPLLLVGGGCVISPGAIDSLQAFVDRTGIPVASTLMGKGAIRENHPLYMGMVGMHGTLQGNMALGRCDLMLAVGTRFSDRVIGDPDKYNEIKGRTIIHVDIDPAEIGKNVRPDIEIEEDAADFFQKMLDFHDDTAESGSWQDWIGQLNEKKAKYEARKQEMYSPVTPLTPQFVVHEVEQALKGQNPIVVTDVGQHQMFAAQHYKVESPRSFITSGGLGTMGFGLPAAIGASSAAPDRTTVLFCGDGGFQMTVQELGLLAKLKLPVKVFILNNGCLGMVRQWQELFFNRNYGCSILDNNPDFCLIAEAYGLPSGLAHDPESLKAEIANALAEEGPYIIHCILDQGENVYPMIPAGKLPHEIIMPGVD